MNVIENSKKGAAERSAENYKSAVETTVGIERINGNILEGEYIIQSDGNICLVSGCGTNNFQKINIEMSGTKLTGGIIMIKDGQVLDGSTLEINGYVINIVDGLGKIGEFGTVVNSISEQTEAIQYDPAANETCETGDTCYNWYVLDGNEIEYAYVSLIMVEI